MDEEVKERVSTLEVILGEFVVRTEKMLRRMEQDTKTFKEEVRQDRKEMNKRWGDLANRLGTLAEDIAAPNVRTIATTRFGCTDIDSYSVRVMRRSRQDRKRLTEFDVVITCGDYLFINETKSTPREEYVLDFAEKLEDIFDFLLEYEGKTVIPIFSSLHLPEPIVQLLTKHKIYAMALGGETMELLNYEAVRHQ